jgi:hypothetical protein
VAGPFCLIWLEARLTVITRVIALSATGGNAPFENQIAQNFIVSYELEP